ncbi:MAG: hypothetical protein AAFX52_06815 [Pseudomonadota bacterium]
MQYVIGAAALFVIAGCVSVNQDPMGLEAADRVCETPGLEAQLTQMSDTSSRIAAAIAYGNENFGIATSGARTNMNVYKTYELRTLMNKYDAEVDAGYRSVVSSCKAHQRCMHANNQREHKCYASLNRWNASESRFQQLAVELRQFELEATAANGG